LTLSIRAARPDDTALIFALVCELADYENLQGEVDATPEEIARALFSPEPRLYCDIAEWQASPSGSSTSRRSGDGTASISKTSLCGRRCASAASARR
jgi:hypothetical protein